MAFLKAVFENNKFKSKTVRKCRRMSNVTKKNACCHNLLWQFGTDFI